MFQPIESARSDRSSDRSLLSLVSARPASAVRPRAAWLRRAAPILVFLERPRTRHQLRDWANERAMSLSRLDELLEWLQDDRQLELSAQEDTWTRI